MNGMNLTPEMPLARSLGRSRDEQRAVALRGLVSQSSRERMLREIAEEDGNPMFLLRQAFDHLKGLLQPYAAGTVAELEAVRKNELLPEPVRVAAAKSMGEMWALPDQRKALGEAVSQHAERMLTAVGANYEHGVAQGRAAEAALEGAAELERAKKQLGVLPRDVPGLTDVLAKLDAAIDNLDPPKHRAAAAPQLGA
ncbi:hypothetical protein [Dolichospermum phage Dfl-JY45]